MQKKEKKRKGKAEDKETERNSDSQRKGRGRMGGNSLGPGGYCVCPSCGEEIEHQRGTPCYQISCPKCDTKMIREDKKKSEK